ncbi:MAG: hypothetical protein WDM92_05875 [Caulobacteraceae bacterium]
MNRYWFKPKTYGYGATPSTWEGWLVTIGFCVAAVVVATVGPHLWTDHRMGALAAGAAFAALLAGFIWLCWIKTAGEWRWRNGEDT